LKTTAGTATDGCFDPPLEDATHRAEGAVLSVSDPIINTVGTGLVKTVDATVFVANTTASVVGAVGSVTKSVGDMLGFDKPPAPKKASSKVGGVDIAGFDLIKALVGSSLTDKDVIELNKTQGGAVALAFGNNQPKDQPKKEGEVLGDQ